MTKIHDMTTNEELIGLTLYNNPSDLDKLTSTMEKYAPGRFTSASLASSLKRLEKKGYVVRQLDKKYALSLEGVVNINLLISTKDKLAQVDPDDITQIQVLRTVNLFIAE
jgi:predicted transcriptional regulator